MKYYLLKTKSGDYIVLSRSVNTVVEWATYHLNTKASAVMITSLLWYNKFYFNKLIRNNNINKICTIEKEEGERVLFTKDIVFQEMLFEVLINKYYK